MKITDFKQELTVSRLKSQLHQKSLRAHVEIVSDSLGAKERGRLAHLHDSIRKFLDDTKVPPESIKGEIIIEVGPQTRVFDPTLAAWGILLAGLLPKVPVTFSFPEGPFGPSPLLYHLNQILLPHLLLGGVPRIELMVGGESLEVYSLEKFLLKYLVASSEYLPPIEINENNYKIYFEEPTQESWNRHMDLDVLLPQLIKTLPKDSKSGSAPFGEQIYGRIREEIIRKTFSKKAPNNESLADVQTVLYLLKALTHMKAWRILLINKVQDDSHHRLYDYAQEKTRLGIGNFGVEKERKYLFEVQRVMTEMLHRPRFAALLFSMLIQNSFSTDFAVDALQTLDRLTERIEALRNLTDELFLGLRELAKNIVVHATKKRGYIVGRIFTARALGELTSERFQSEERAYLARYKENQPFLDCVVFDDGAQGILEKTQEKVKQLFREIDDEKIRDGLSNELREFRDGSLNLDAFFDLQRVRMFHQRIRTSASLGLLMFSDLLRSNNGFLRAHTIHGDGVRGTVIDQGVSQLATETQWFASGTHYEILLPVSPKDLVCARQLPSTPIESVNAGDAYDLMARIRIMSSESLTISPCKKLNNKSMCLHTLSISSVNWEKFVIDNHGILDAFRLSGCREHYRKILAIELSDEARETDPSELFRFLSHIQLEIGFSAVVIYNISENTVRTLCDICRIYGAVMGVPLWNRNQAVLFYFAPRETNSSYLNFHTFMLTGESLSELNAVNERIHPHSPGDPIWRKFINSPIPMAAHVDIDNPLLVDGRHLLPFDVVLRVAGLTLFEWNMRANLMRDLSEDAS